ncbi:MAG: enoyl-CoA hydratase-related protein [Nitrospirales bacterium]
MTNQFINHEISDRIAVVTLSHPPANSLNSQVMKELSETIGNLSENAEASVVVITGGGNLFVAGADIREIASIPSAQRGAELAAMGQEILDRIEGLNKPVIAAINGLFCLGGGLELAMACHIRIAGERVRFGQPEIDLGIIPAFGGTQRLTRLVGKGRAIQLILTGNRITAQEAKAIGLVDQVVPDGEVLKQARGLARKIASKGQIAVRAALKAVMEGQRVPLEEGLALESKLFGSLCESADMKEGIKAFLEKRQPKFEDR